MPSGKTDFDGLVAAVYDAAFDASLWPALLAKLEAAIGGYGTGWFIIDLQNSMGINPARVSAGMMHLDHDTRK